MKIDISTSPVFNVPLTKKQVNVLIKLAKHHYDATCKEASGENGFLTRWKNLIVVNAQISADYPDPDYDFFIRAAFHELDICLKILEMRFVAQSATMISETEARRCSGMAFDFNGALSLANSKYREWKTSFGR